MNRKTAMGWRLALLFPLVLTLLLLSCGDGENEGPPATATAPPTHEATGTPTGAPSPVATERTTTALRFDPDAFTCANAPTPTLDREWQVSAPRQPVQGADAIELGLRNKFGTADERYSATVSLIRPDGGSIEGAAAAVDADAFGYVTYPDAFAEAAPLEPGIYTVVWEIDGGFVACDGFTVS